MRTLSEILGLESPYKLASIEYHGHTFPGYNKPIDNKGGGKHKKVVLAKKGDKVKMIGFGHRDYQHNYSAKAKANYLKRSAGIKNKSGELTKNDKLSANYWARRVLWPSGPATGAAKKTAHVEGAEETTMDFRKVAASAGRTQALAVLGLKTAETSLSVLDTTDPDKIPLVGMLPFGSVGVGAVRGADVGSPFEGAARGFLGGTLGGMAGGIVGNIAGRDASRVIGLMGKAYGTHALTRELVERKLRQEAAAAAQEAAAAGAKTANYLPTGAARRMLGHVGGHALSGAATGALGGAMGAESGHRMEGALRGGAVGGALGGALGAANLGVIKARGMNPDHVLQDRATLRDIMRAGNTTDTQEAAHYLMNEHPLAAAQRQSVGVGMANPVLTGAAGMSSQWGLGRDEQR